MSTDQVDRIDSESDRLAAVSELETSEGPDWANEFAPGTHGCHELLDRVHLISSMLQQSVVEHPACLHNAAWYRLAGKAVEALEKLYQEIGATHLGPNCDQ